MSQQTDKPTRQDLAAEQPSQGVLEAIRERAAESLGNFVNQLDKIELDDDDDEGNKQEENVKAKEMEDQQKQKDMRQNPESGQQLNDEQKLQLIEQLRRKESLLREELQKVKREQRRILQNLKKDSLAAGRSRTIEQKQQGAKMSNIPLKRRLPPPKRSSPLKKLQIDTKKAVPEISKEQFEETVKNIAQKIRSKVKKLKPIQQEDYSPRRYQRREIPSAYAPDESQVAPPTVNLGSYSSRRSSSYRQSSWITDASPAASPNKSANFPIIQSRLSDIYSASNNFGQEEQEEGERASMVTVHQPGDPQSNRVIKLILKDIIGEALRQAEHKQKYSLKLEPVTHKKYPMTTFRKRIIEQKKQISISPRKNQPLNSFHGHI